SVTDVAGGALSSKSSQSFGLGVSVAHANGGGGGGGASLPLDDPSSPLLDPSMPGPPSEPLDASSPVPPEDPPESEEDPHANAVARAHDVTTVKRSRRCIPRVYPDAQRQSRVASGSSSSFSSVSATSSAVSLPRSSSRGTA